MTNREKLKEVFGAFVHFENALDTEWLNWEYKEPVRYTPKNNDVVEFFDGSFGFVDGNTIINKCPFVSDGWAIWHIDRQLDMGSIKYIYRGTSSPLYYVMGKHKGDLQLLDIVYAHPSTSLKN